MSGHGEVKPTVAMCLWIWAALLVLLLVTFIVGDKVNAGKLNFVIAFSIAMTKALLIILFFMHIYYSHPLIRLIAASGFFFLVILIFFTLCDFDTRDYRLEPDAPEHPIAASHETTPAAHAP
jgi:cytochrome c oxidase subunit IV